MAGVNSDETAASMAAWAVLGVFPGFKFSPTDVELISYYLRRKVDGLEKSVEVIPEVEIYNFEPWDLPDKSIVKSDSEWFFFCARGRKYPHGSKNRRATEMGYWKATGKERNVKSGSEVVGTKRTLVFHIGRAPKGERTEWIMHEYCLNGVPPDALVLCRLRRNSDFRASSSQATPVEKNVILQNGAGPESISEWESMVDFYLSTKSVQNLINDFAESSQTPPAASEKDFYADVLGDEIVKLDESLIQAPLLPPIPNELPTHQLEPATSRLLPLPDMIDRQIKSVFQREMESLSGKEDEKQKETLSRCVLGLVWIKKATRRWLNVALAVVLLAYLLEHLLSAQGNKKFLLFEDLWFE